MEISIKTNNHWNNFMYGYELSDKQKEDFDYMEYIDYESFISYRGYIYSLDQFTVIGDKTPFGNKWGGYHSDSFFSGVLIKLSDDCEQYQIATYNEAI